MSRPTEMIFEYLLQNHSLTIPQLSQALHLTRADIRHHLNELILTGRVVKSATSDPSQVGRPAHTYHAIRPINRVWIQTLVETQNQFLRSLGISDQEISAHCAEAILSGFAPIGHPTSRLNQAVAFLRKKGIEAKWIAGPDGPLITLSETEFLSQDLTLAIIEGIQKEL